MAWQSTTTTSLRPLLQLISVTSSTYHLRPASLIQPALNIPSFHRPTDYCAKILVDKDQRYSSRYFYLISIIIIPITLAWSSIVLFIKLQITMNIHPDRSDVTGERYDDSKATINTIDYVDEPLLGSARRQSQMEKDAPWWKKFISGGSGLDAFQMEAGQQIGQSLMSLPWTFALMGYPLGIISFVFLSLASMWTQYMLISLLAEFHQQIDKDNNHPLHNNEHHILSFHEVIGGLVGKCMGHFSLLIVFLALLGLCVAQIVASASNLYLLSDALPKRTYACILAGIMSLLSFVPTFRHYRFLAFLAVVGTAYTALYLTIDAATIGPQEDVAYGAPTSFDGFFTGFVNLVFMFGAHTAAIEKAVVMDDPYHYDKAYGHATIYVYLITLPTGITGYHSFGLEAQHKSNAFYLFPESPARSIALVLMIIHQFVAFGLFGGPLFHIWEKLLKVDKQEKYWLRILSRLSVCGVMLFFAVAFPFFGVINSVLGAFTTTFGTFIIPPLAYNMFYNSEERIANQPEVKKAHNMRVYKAINWIIIFLLFVLGFGCGGYSSMVTLIDKVHTFHLFDECYGC